MKIFVGISLLCTLSAAAVINWSAKPLFCKNHNCPKYSVVSSNEKFELRSYNQSYWATVKMVTNGYWQDGMTNRRSFWTLLGYITGQNVQALKMEMTAPVLRYHQRDQVLMAFMIPYALYGKAPQPTDSSVNLFTSPAMEVYVKKFSGEVWNPEYDHSARLQEFRSDLAANNITITTNTFYVAGYDGPTVYHGDKHNEIWIARP